MSRFENTPAELGEMEVKEAVLSALQKVMIIHVDKMLRRVFIAVFNYCTLTEEFGIDKLSELIETVITRNCLKMPFQSLASELVNQLIACEFITQQTLEELGQKQLNEAY